jgi:hypothetical protein
VYLCQIELRFLLKRRYINESDTCVKPKNYSRLKNVKNPSADTTARAIDKYF